MLYEKILTELEKNNVRYLIIGGLAVFLYGYDRVTKDLDLMLSFDNENMVKFISIAKSLGLRSKVPVEIEELADEKKRELWIKEKNMKVFSFYNPNDDMEYIDIMIQDYIDFEKAYKNKKLIEFKKLGIKVKAISINDLIKLKEIAGRNVDRIDIMALKKIYELNYGE